MMGMSSIEWSGYMHEELGVKMPPEEISAAVVERMEGLYREHLPLIPGAREAVERVAARWPLGLASSANRPVIEVVLELSDLGNFFETTLSSEEVARGKPARGCHSRMVAHRRSTGSPQVRRTLWSGTSWRGGARELAGWHHFGLGKASSKEAIR
jgi:hypothetical protein